MMQVDMDTVLAEAYRALGEATVAQRLFRQQAESLAAENEQLRAQLATRAAPPADVIP